MARVLALESSSLALAPDVHAPLGDRYRENDVDRDRGEGDRGEAPVEFGEQDRRHQAEFQDHRNDREQHVRKQRGDAARAALDVARHAAGLAIEMEAQAQAVQMAEHGERDAADRALRHAHEHHVAQLGEQRRRQPQHAVGDEQRKRQHQHRGRGVERDRRPPSAPAARRRWRAWPRRERRAQPARALCTPTGRAAAGACFAIRCAASRPDAAAPQLVRLGDGPCG